MCIIIISEVKGSELICSLPTALTQEGVRLAMNEAEAIDLERGNIVMNHEAVSPCVLMMSGMDLEEQQSVKLFICA